MNLDPMFTQSVMSAVFLAMTFAMLRFVTSGKV